MKPNQIPTRLLPFKGVKNYALKVSRERRAGKFTRVGLRFHLAVEAAVEARLRQLVSVPASVEPPEGLKLTTRLLRSKIDSQLESLVKSIIQSKVINHPSMGVTLLD